MGEVLCMYVCTLSAALWVLANGSGVEITTRRCAAADWMRPSKQISPELQSAQRV